jgi:hypothetical protein
LVLLVIPAWVCLVFVVLILATSPQVVSICICRWVICLETASACEHPRINRSQSTKVAR